MQYKLLALDLDDTLLRDDLTVSKKNINAISDAVNNGIKVVIASGRGITSAKPYYDLLNLDTPLITHQGAVVVDNKRDKPVYEKPLKKNEALPIIKFAEKIKIHCNIYADEIIYIEKMNKWANFYHKKVKNMPMKAVGRLSQFINKPTTKIVLIDEADRIKNIKPEAEKIVGKNINVFISKPNYLEFTNKYATKGKGLQFVAEYFGIKREEIIAIGDTYNDISMLEYAGLGVCMSNGPEDVRHIADYVTLSNEENGVAHVIEKFVL